ncbi:MAG: hypothetical protein LUC50_00325 [Ruminococcus sp.]|nr:hypothetical protein [Ruminococcus sp.]
MSARCWNSQTTRRRFRKKTIAFALESTEVVEPTAISGVLVNLTFDLPDVETVRAIAEAYQLTQYQDGDTIYYAFPLQWADPEQSTFAYLDAQNQDCFSSCVRLEDGMILVAVPVTAETTATTLTTTSEIDKTQTTTSTTETTATENLTSSTDTTTAASTGTSAVVTMGTRGTPMQTSTTTTSLVVTMGGARNAAADQQHNDYHHDHYDYDYDNHNYDHNNHHHDYNDNDYDNDYHHKHNHGNDHHHYDNDPRNDNADFYHNYRHDPCHNDNDSHNHHCTRHDHCGVHCHEPNRSRSGHDHFHGDDNDRTDNDCSGANGRGIFARRCESGRCGDDSGRVRSAAGVFEQVCRKGYGTNCRAGDGSGCGR